MHTKLFPTDSQTMEWREFPAQGFSKPVSGAICRRKDKVSCGMPLGGIDTGCLDLETNGTLGYCSIFNSHVPRRGPLNLPFLGVSLSAKAPMIGAGNRTWVLTTQEIKGVKNADEIHYWGHYPVADLEYEMDAPVSVGLRAWAPFVLGDVIASTLPGIIFEAHLRNTNPELQKGTLAFSFPGPTEEECGGSYACQRKAVEGNFNGVVVEAKRENLEISYALGVVDEKARAGGEIGMDGGKWSRIDTSLPPQGPDHLGASLAVDFQLQPMETKAIRFILAWHAPYWLGNGSGDFSAISNPQFMGVIDPLIPCRDDIYSHMYAKYHPDALKTAQELAGAYQSLQKRVFAWQQVIYGETSLPVWLRDALVNVLHLITEDGFWAQAKPPIGAWCREEDGLFAMIESPRSCPQMECIPCSFMGNWPLVYFFPELALSTLRAYKAYQFSDGQAPWNFGGPCGITTPGRGLSGQFKEDGTLVKPQVTLDGPCYVDMVDRLWLRTGNREILEEFYVSVKKNTIFTMNLRPGSGPAGIISMPKDNYGWDWYEHCDIFGMCSHVGGVHLANLRMAERMALEMDDKEFAKQCRLWIKQGSEMLEGHLWNEKCYLFYNELETGRKSDMVAAFQLDGEWMAVFHGLAGVFRPDRVTTTLATIKQTSMALTDKGVVIFINPDGSPIEGVDDVPLCKPGKKGYNKVGYWGAYGIATPATVTLAMTYMYNGKKDVGLKLVWRYVREMAYQGWTWDMPVLFNGKTSGQYGTDYYQNMLLWALPAAMAGKDLRGHCEPGGLVERIIEAGKKNNA